MSKQRSRDTAAELAVRRELHQRGLRYRVHVRPLAALRREADIVFSAVKLAVMVDGCFWHSCPEHGSRPKSNQAWWEAKIQRNVERDRDTDRALAEAGWAVIRVWEHEPVDSAATRIEALVTDRRGLPRSGNPSRKSGSPSL